MLLKIENLGVVKEAQIDLSKDLILLCGQNNTGKTYVAYTLAYFFNYPIGSFLNETLHNLYNFEYSDKEHKIGFHAILQHPKIQEFAKELLEKEEVAINMLTCIDDLLMPLQKDIFKELYRIHFRQNSFVNYLNNPNIENVSFDFEITKEHILEHLNNLQKDDLKDYTRLMGLPFSIKIFDNHLTIRAEYKGISFHPRIVIDGQEFSQESPNVVEPEYKEKFAYLEKFTYKEKIDYLAEVIYRQMIGVSIDRYRKSVVFPAQRSAINIFATELSLIKNKVFEATLKDKSLSELAQRRTYRYAEPIKDNLLTVQDLISLSKKKSDFAHLATELENSILQGKIIVGKYGELLYIPKTDSKVRLEMHQSSSLVESLAMLVFYLRYTAQKNDCLVIDEPELNLHPDNQILVARFLGRLVHEGFKVIISTHSDYIIRELNNLIMLSKESSYQKNLLAKYAYSKKELLKSSQIEALLFRKEKNTVKVTPIEVDERGLTVDTIDDTIENLENKAQDIYYKLFKAE